MKPIDELKTAMKEKDRDVVEEALFAVDEDEEGYVEILIELLRSDWHEMHEDIAQELQRLKDPAAIDVLKQTAERKFKYLSYNNSEALGRKCTWALADIGTEGAKIALLELSRSSDEVISGYAQRRLDRWDQEKSRKGT